METPRNEGYISTASNPMMKDDVGLSGNQRMLAWVALAAGVIALIWGLTRVPDTNNRYGTNNGTGQLDPATNTSDQPR